MTATEIGSRLVRAYEPANAGEWDELVARSVNGTFLHTRRFLGYHGGRFRDRSLLVTDGRGRLAGVFPAAEDPAGPAAVSSHPGLSYGGLVHDGSLAGASMISAFGEIAAHYRALGYRWLRYKAVPYIYQAAPTGDDLYALFRLGASRAGCDLAAVVDLDRRGPVRADRRRAGRRAAEAGVSVQAGWAQITGFWQLLEASLAGRHGAAPTHSLAEICDLHDRFPDRVILVTASAHGQLAAGCLFFFAGQVLSGQYLAATAAGRAAGASDPAIEHGLRLARDLGCRYVSFGTSTLQRGGWLNESQYDYKLSFGARGLTHDHYKLTL
jgi:Acetyltransferase (GNAT) domain